MTTSKIIILAFATSSLFACSNMDKNFMGNIFDENQNTNQASSQDIPENMDNNFGIEVYDEDAVDDYIDGLKGVAQFFSAIHGSDSSLTGQAKLMLGLASGKMKTSVIEIENWPYAARKKAWNIKGKRMQSYNDLINTERSRIMADDAIDVELKDMVESIKLLTKSSLLAAG